MVPELEAHRQKMNLDLSLTPGTKMNSKWTPWIEMFIKRKTVKLTPARKKPQEKIFRI